MNHHIHVQFNSAEEKLSVVDNTWRNDVIKLVHEAKQFLSQSEEFQRKMCPLLTSMEQAAMEIEIERGKALGWEIQLQKERLKYANHQRELSKLCMAKTDELNELLQRLELIQKLR